MKERIRPHYARVRRLSHSAIHSIRTLSNRRPTVAHQGIQRSGTNYLAHLLTQSGYFVVNGVDPKRDDPRHKHFRWQRDKSTIVMDEAFRNDLYAEDIGDVNRLAGFQPDQRHVVIFKTPHSWVTSISRWGLANGWISATAELGVLAGLAQIWLAEWDAYYSTWINLQRRDPEMILIVCYEDLTADPAGILTGINQFLGHPHPSPLCRDGLVDKVAHSSRRSEPKVPPLLPSNVTDDLVSEVVTCDWPYFIREGTA